MRELEAKSPPSLSLIANIKDVDNAIPMNDYPPLRSVKVDDGGYSHVRNELLAILNELRFITHKIKEDIDAVDETNDWKFAAMVIDRLCFWIFSAYWILTTLGIFFSAPNMFK
jgi:nicotinic acetylcholine receptor